jgi:hypothetical protein
MEATLTPSVPSPVAVATWTADCSTYPGVCALATLPATIPRLVCVTLSPDSAVASI